MPSHEGVVGLWFTHVVHGMEGLSSELPTLRACPLRSINPQCNDQDPRFPSMHDILYAPKCQFLRQEFYKVDRDAEFVNKETLNVGFHTSAKMQTGPFFRVVTIARTGAA